MTIGNYSTLLIGDYIIAGLSRYSNIWKGYFKPSNAINCGIVGDRVENILWRCLIIYHHPLISRMLSSCVAQTKISEKIPDL